MTRKIKAYISLLRPYQWMKNILLFAPLFFAGKMFDSGAVLHVTAGVGCFCILSSLGYVMNDWVDRKNDAVHPAKKGRPLCSGTVSGFEAMSLSLSLLLIVVCFMGYFPFPKRFILIACLYFILTASYSLYFKRIEILELFIVSMGFVFRVLAGGATAGVAVSSWLFMTVFFISILISVSKRLSELTRLGEEKAVLHRVSQEKYHEAFLVNLLWTCGGISLVVYALYAVERSGIVVYSVIPASYGVFRFIFLSVQGKGGDPIKALLCDKHLLMVTLGFLSLLGLTIYV